MVVIAGDMNVGISNVSDDGMHGFSFNTATYSNYCENKWYQLLSKDGIVNLGRL